MVAPHGWGNHSLAAINSALLSDWGGQGKTSVSRTGGENYYFGWLAIAVVKCSRPM